MTPSWLPQTLPRQSTRPGNTRRIQLQRKATASPGMGWQGVKKQTLNRPAVKPPAQHMNQASTQAVMSHGARLSPSCRDEGAEERMRGLSSGRKQREGSVPPLTVLRLQGN